MPLDPAVAAVRRSVRGELPERGTGGTGAAVLVACSGGADSTALLAATVVEGHRRGLRVVGVTVDHGLQLGSTDRAAEVVARMVALGADETVSVRVRVEAAGQGPEAAAREARYAVLREVAQRVGDPAHVPPVLLGHTLDDQAETVLLGLARGSGTRSLSGMRRRFDCFVRPLLDVTREQTESACRAEGLGWWSDPHNTDPRFTRSRVRHDVLPVLERELGPGVAAALARTAQQCRRDADHLDDLANLALVAARVPGAAPGADRGGDGLRAAELARLAPAVLHRVLRLAALEAGALASDLTFGHVEALADLVPGPSGPLRHKEIRLPGHVTARRDGNTLRFGPTPVAG